MLSPAQSLLPTAAPPSRVQEKYGFPAVFTIKRGKYILLIICCKTQGLSIHNYWVMLPPSCELALSRLVAVTSTQNKYARPRTAWNAASQCGMLGQRSPGYSVLSGLAGRVLYRSRAVIPQRESQSLKAQWGAPSVMGYNWAYYNYVSNSASKMSVRSKLPPALLLILLVGGCHFAEAQSNSSKS